MAQSPSGELPAPALGEFCGTPPASIVCPKTSASKCACSLSGKKSQTQQQIEPLIELVTVVRLPRVKPTAKVIPESPWSLSLITHDASVPTPPPRF